MLTATIDSTREWTVEDYLQLEEGLLAQLIDGELIRSPAPTPRHQEIIGKLFIIFQTPETPFKSFFSPIDLYLNEKNVLQPDLVCFKDDTIVTERGIEGAPEIVVEVVSPSNSYIDRNIKKRKYLEFGVKEVWLVDPGNRTIEMYVDNIDKPLLYLAGEGRVTSKVIPQLSFELDKLFS